MRSDFALDRGDVVQINPEFKSIVFAGCMMTVTEVKGKKISDTELRAAIKEAGYDTGKIIRKQ